MSPRLVRCSYLCAAATADPPLFITRHERMPMRKISQDQDAVGAVGVCQTSQSACPHETSRRHHSPARSTRSTILTGGTAR